jgi:hypothetical protein
MRIIEVSSNSKRPPRDFLNAKKKFHFSAILKSLIFIPKVSLFDPSNRLECEGKIEIIF